MGDRTLEQVYTEIATAMVEFEQGHAAFAEKGNKSAAARARKAYLRRATVWESSLAKPAKGANCHLISSTTPA